MATSTAPSCAGWCSRSTCSKNRNHMKRHILIGAAFITAIVALGVASRLLDRTTLAAAAAAVQAPRFEVDPLWPKPLPNKWILGQTIGVAVDAQDHVWII